MRETPRNIQKNSYNNLQKNVVSSIKIEVVLFSFVLPKNNITTHSTVTSAQSSVCTTSHP